MANTNNPNRFLRILQWNCLSFTQRKAHLTTISSNYDIIILLETKLSPKNNPAFPNFVMVRKDRLESGRGGIAILIRKDIPFRIIDTAFHASLDLETLAISTSSPQGDLLTLLFISLLPELLIPVCGNASSTLFPISTISSSAETSTATILFGVTPIPAK